MFSLPHELCHGLSQKQRPTQPREGVVPGSPPEPSQKLPRAETFAQSPSSRHDSNLCLSKAAGYRAMGSFHLELFKLSKLKLWLSESHHGFSQGRFHRTLVPSNVYRCWVIVGPSNEFEEHWHFKQVPFLRTSAPSSCQLSESVTKGRVGSSSNLFDHLLFFGWDMFYRSAFQTFTCTWFTWELSQVQFPTQKILGEAWDPAFLPARRDVAGTQTTLETVGFEKIFLKGVCCVPYPRGSCDLPVTALTPAQVLGSWEKWARHWAGVEARESRVPSVLVPAVCPEPRAVPGSQGGSVIPVEWWRS